METIQGENIIKNVKQIEQFQILPNGLIVINNRVIQFDNPWNRNRHILGIMATIDNNLRLADRRN